MRFQKFTESGRSYNPKVTLSTNGAMSFNEGACARFEIKNYDYAVLYFDPEGREIAVSFTNDKSEEGARKIRKRDMGAHVAAKPFLDKWNILPRQTTIYSASVDSEFPQFVIVDINNGRARNRKPRSLEE